MQSKFMLSQAPPTCIINIGRMLILELPQKQNGHPVGYIMLLKTWSSALLKAYLLSTNNGNATWTVNGHQGPRQGTKPVSGKIANYSYYYSYSCSYS